MRPAISAGLRAALATVVPLVSHDLERALDQVTTEAISRGVAHPVD